MTIRERAVAATARLLKVAIGLTGRHEAAIAARLVERLSPVVDVSTPHGPIRFFCPGSLPEFRARTLLSKEPETLRWIDTFGPDDVFWDIGANVGSYSLYAGRKGITTVAFEPSAGNYYLLNRNIEINRLDDRILAYCIAFNDATGLAGFHMQNTEIGGALSSFAEAIDWQGRPFETAFKQAMIGFAIDSFVGQFAPPFPNHVKIDVDGHEDRIIVGGSKTLADTRVKSVLAELDGGRKDYLQRVTDTLAAAGLQLSERGHEVSVANRTGSISYLYLFRRG